MNHYTLEERETIYCYDPIEKCWYIHSNHIPHINRILERAEVKKVEKAEKGRIIYVEAIAAPNQVRLFKP